MTRTIAISAVALVAVLAAPRATSAAVPPGEPIAESMFLCDTLPPGGRDLTLAVAVAPAPPGAGAAPSSTAFAASPRLQLATALGERVGLTADVGLGSNGRALDAPGASLKLLLRAAAPGRTGVSVSADLYGASHDPLASEAGAALGLLRTLGAVTLRVGGSVATRVSALTPHLHGGASAALALGGRVHVLGEVVGMTGGGGPALAAGPTVKVAVGDGASLAAGALFPLSGELPAFTVQLAHGI